MASSLSLCSSLLQQTKLPNNLKTTSFCFPQNNLKEKNLKFVKNTHFLCSNNLKKTQFVSKVSEIDALVAEETGIEVLEKNEETDIEEAKREDIFAVVMIGGRQYIVFPGRFLHTQRFKGANVNDKVILNKVLLVGTKNSTYVGKPLVPNATVHAVVEEQGLNKKVVVFKYKKKKNYRRNIGHRQPNTRIKILGITGYEDSPATTL